MKVFYYDAYTCEEAETPVDLPSLEAIIEKFKAITVCDGSFFGVVGNNDETLQFAWDDDDFGDLWLVDIPVMEKDGSYQTHATVEKCIEYITNFFHTGELPTGECTFEKF